MKRAVYILLAAVLSLTVVVALRTARFGSRQMNVSPAKEFALDMPAMAERLSRAIRYQTVSKHTPENAALGAFREFRDFLATSFPTVHAQLSREVIGGGSLLFTWKGQNPSLKPVLLMAHMDVVPVDPKTVRTWRYPPFSGRIAGGYIWGRGAMDDKASVLGILEAVEYLLAQGFAPQRTVYLAFGHDEEIGGASGAAVIAALLQERGVELQYVLDEGGNITDGIVPQIRQPAALIGIAEKGYLSLELTVETPGGHASIPPAHTAIGIISRAIYQLERAPFPTRLSQPTRQLLLSIGAEMSWPQKLVLANLWLFRPLVTRTLASTPIGSALVRTTQAATVFAAGIKDNVLPAKARAVVNYRLLPGDTVDSVTDRVRRTIADTRIKLTPLPVQLEPSPVSSVESESFELLRRTIRQVAPGVLVAPSLLVAATDSRHYAGLTPNIFRFLPITLRPEDTNRYHGTNERIAIKDYARCVRFYVQLIRNSATRPLS